MGDRFVRGPWGGGGGGSGTPRAAGTLRDPGTPRGSGTPRAHGTPRAFAPARRMNLSELATGLFFISLIAYFGYDGFNQIFTKPEPFKPKEAQESIAELKAVINRDLDHKYLKNLNAERRSALATDPPQRAEEMYIMEPVYQVEEEEQQYNKVVIVSAMQEMPCLAEGGDRLHYLSVLNKQDYARINNYEFVLGIRQLDPELENMWNKPAWINKVLADEENPAEWVLWMDIDTVVLDANYTLPFEEFAAKSKDLVVYGNQTEVQAGHPVRALNTGVMAIRNTPWARHFFKEVARLGRLDDHHRGKNTLSKVLLKELQAGAYSDGLRDQNAVIYLLKTHPEWQDRVLFQDKEICLNCYWQDLIGVTGYGKPKYARQENVSFVQHFMGCQTCNELNRNGDLDACREGMQHSFDFTARYQAPMLVDARPRSEADKSQLRELPYCSNNPTAHGCMGAKPLDEERQRQVEKERHRPTFDWKAVDNATVASTISDSADQPKLDSGTLSTGADTSRKPITSSAKEETQPAGLTTSRAKAGGLENIDPEAGTGDGSMAGNRESGGYKARDVTTEVKKVERRWAAEGRTFEGMRRPRHKRMSAKRASHSVKSQLAG